MFFALMITTFLIVLIMPFLTCRPITKMWQIDPDPGREWSPMIFFFYY